MTRYALPAALALLVLCALPYAHHEGLSHAQVDTVRVVDTLWMTPLGDSLAMRCSRIQDQSGKDCYTVRVAYHGRDER